MKLASTQRGQTSAKAKILTKSDPGIQIRISGLIWIVIQISTRLLPECCGFITIRASVISLSVVKIDWCMRNANKSKILYSAMVREVEK